MKLRGRRCFVNASRRVDRKRFPRGRHPPPPLLVAPGASVGTAITVTVPDHRGAPAAMYTETGPETTATGTDLLYRTRVLTGEDLDI